MSQENVEIVRRVYEAYERGDFDARAGRVCGSGRRVAVRVRALCPIAGATHGHRGVGDVLRRLARQPGSDSESRSTRCVDAGRPRRRARDARTGAGRAAALDGRASSRLASARSATGKIVRSRPVRDRDRSPRSRGAVGVEADSALTQPVALRLRTRYGEPRYCAGDVAGERRTSVREVYDDVVNRRDLRAACALWTAPPWSSSPSSRFRTRASYRGPRRPGSSCGAGWQRGPI